MEKKSHEQQSVYQPLISFAGLPNAKPVSHGLSHSTVSDRDMVEEETVILQLNGQDRSRQSHPIARLVDSQHLYARWAASQSKVHHAIQAMKQFKKEKDQ